MLTSWLEGMGTRHSTLVTVAGGTSPGTGGGRSGESWPWWSWWSWSSGGGGGGSGPPLTAASGGGPDALA